MVMSSGNVLFLGENPIARGIMEWNPSAGQLTAINPDPKFSVFFSQGTIGARSADGTKAIFSTNTLPSSLAIFDATTDSFVSVNQSSNFAFALAANPTGTQFAIAVNLADVSIVDSHFNQIGHVPAGGTLYGMMYSPDGKKLYIVHMPGNVPVVSTVDTSTFQVLGQAPAYASVLAFVTRVPPFFVENPMATDSTGLVFGVGDHGVAIDDSSYFQNISPTATPSVAASIVNPAEGPQKSSTTVSIATQLTNSAPSVWFGALPGLNPSLNSSGQVQVATPPSPSVGSVNVKLFSPDGTEGNVPNGFTYGVVPIASPVLAVTASGGLSADIFGYGFGSDVSSPLQVQIGAASASIQQNALFPAEYIFGYPFPLDHVRVAVPSGSPGAADITITSSAGSGKIAGGMHYVQSVNDYPSSDSFTFILYDAHRSQLYLSARDHIDVFSLASHSFLTPIVPPSVGGHFQMLGLALTPDGSKLLAANYIDSSVAIINPDNPASAQDVQVPQGSALGFEGPTQLVCNNLNHALIAVSSSSLAGVGAGLLFDMDLSTFSVKPVSGPFSTGVFDNFLGSSRDGSKLVVGIPGEGVFVLDSTTNTWSVGPPRNPFEVAASGDGNVFVNDSLAPPPSSATSLSFFDSHANLIAVTGLPEYLDSKPALAGIKLNDAGSLAYVGTFFDIPITGSTFSQDFVEIYDVQHDEIRERVLLAEKLLPEEAAQNGLAIDPTGQNIFLLTTTGLTIITLDSVPLSIGSVTPNSGAGGTAVTIRGSGFTQQTTATCNGIAVSITFVDADTLDLVLPASLASGPVSITLANPDGSTYDLDVAFHVN
jgi:IPT/TIG domain